MQRHLPELLALVLAAALAGCATQPHDTPTYSGDLKAAVQDDVAVVKSAGNSAAAYIRNSLSSPMPAWNSTAGTDSASGQPPSAPAGAAPSTASTASEKSADAGVQVYAVGAGGADAPGSLAVTPETKLAEPGKRSAN
jgi:hypothetical protein